MRRGARMLLMASGMTARRIRLRKGAIPGLLPMSRPCMNDTTLTEEAGGL